MTFAPHDIRKETCLNLPVQSPPSSSDQLAFYQRDFRSVREVFQHGLNENFWRWGLVFNQGNGWNVSENSVRERLRMIASDLLRTIYGNRFRNKAKLRFVVFRHGSSKSFDEHYHALMGFEGEPPHWSDDLIKLRIEATDWTMTNDYTKLVHVDIVSKDGNRYHSYVSQFEQQGRSGSDNWFFL